ncbi:MAG: signal peptidase II [candidate division Zixibacteria bacterium]|nr:signal peptidase II [candidate division Zixibacteria bacterium]MDH3935866.1 signal peptidase II [candidate division Zixibacteria bacterium]MDH4032896.1 signal peptidase II [candidate division Zixibacteria bacterium]
MPGYASIASHPKRKRSLAPKNAKNLLWPLVIIIAVLLADQVSKILAVHYLAESSSGSVEVLGRFLMFTLVYNEGGAMGTNLGSSTYYLIASLLILLFLLYYVYLARSDRMLANTLAFVAGGAMGNIVDRIRLGRVIDFIDVNVPDITLFDYGLQRWWTFNIADSAITCAIIVLLIRMIFGRKDSLTAPDKQPSDIALKP